MCMQFEFWEEEDGCAYIILIIGYLIYFIFLLMCVCVNDLQISSLRIKSELWLNIDLVHLGFIAQFWYIIFSCNHIL